MSKVLGALPLPEIYFEHRKSRYWMRNAEREWITINESQLKRQLKMRGYSSSGNHTNGQLSEADLAIARIQDEQTVLFAGPLAGFRTGMRKVGNARILVTEGPRLIKPQDIPWPTLEQLFEGMFVQGETDQRIYFFGWLKTALEHLRLTFEGPQRQSVLKGGQALALAGPAQAGKSLCQDLITEMLGGRSANAQLFISGKSNFNSDLFRAEHLMIEDSAESTIITKRFELGSNIKQITSNKMQLCHGKNQEAITMDPFWRLSLTMNSEPERMMILPPLDADIADKIMLLKVCRREMPMPCSTPEEREQFRARLSVELPGFLYHLEQLEIPEHLKDHRFGICAYHHPEMKEILESNSPEMRLLDMIDRALWKDQEVALKHGGGASNEFFESKSFKAAELLKVLRDDYGVGDEAKDLLPSAIKVGHYLGRLKSKMPERVSSRIISGLSEWTITPPARLLNNQAEPKS